MSGSIYRSTDPLRPVDWRAQSAEFIVNTDRALLGGGHGRLTAEVVRFLRWERRCRSPGDEQRPSPIARPFARREPRAIRSSLSWTWR